MPTTSLYHSIVKFCRKNKNILLSTFYNKHKRMPQKIEMIILKFRWKRTEYRIKFSFWRIFNARQQNDDNNDDYVIHDNTEKKEMAWVENFIPCFFRMNIILNTFNGIDIE